MRGARSGPQVFAVPVKGEKTGKEGYGMAFYELRNDEVSIVIDSRGAELKSLKKLSTGAEYMWCGDAEYWARTSPILFPFVGGLRDKVYRTKGETYPMTQHGFARDMEFELLEERGDEIWFVLNSSEETLKKFPYEFVLKLGYRIAGSRVEVLWRVENPGDETLPFAIGGHPAFNCPMEEGAKRSECFVDFNVPEVVSSRVGESGLVTGCMDVFRLNEGRLPITDNLFDHDALVIENSQTDTVALCGRDGSRYLTVTMEAPLFGVWSPSGKTAPFVCIEPWYGRCDAEGFEGTLEEREWENLIGPGEVFRASYVIEV